jgi:hypothetical protein
MQCTNWFGQKRHVSILRIQSTWLYPGFNNMLWYKPGQGHGFPIMLWSALCSVSSVKMRDDCSFCWYWWNWWPSLFKLPFHNLTIFLCFLGIFFYCLSYSFTIFPFHEAYSWFLDERRTRVYTLEVLGQSAIDCVVPKYGSHCILKLILYFFVEFLISLYFRFRWFCILLLISWYCRFFIIQVKLMVFNATFSNISVI